MRSFFGLVVAVFLLITGCGRGGLAVRDSGAFRSASSELKGQWDLAMAAAQTNGYLLAYTNLQSLQGRTGLTAEQSKAVEEMLGVVGTRMFNAANQGDAEATKALKEVQATSKRR